MTRQVAQLATQPPARLLAAWLFVALLAGAALIALAYQVPAAHSVDIGGYDAAYTQGFYEPTTSDGAAPAYLAGSDGNARWTRTTSYLLFPQIGLPAELTLRLRGVSDQPIAVLLGDATLGTITPSREWQTYSFRVSGGLAKLSDVLIELRATTTVPISAQDPRQVGVLLDRAELQTIGWPISPYPVPMLLGGVASALLVLLLRRATGIPWRQWALGMALLTLAFIGVYRLQPAYPYPLRGLLPTVNLALAILLGLRYGPAALRRLPRLLDGVALGAVAVWFGATLVQAQQHLVLSLPGVENDFRVFALRSAQLSGVFQPSGMYNSTSDGVFRADGFYNLGYPFLLWLLRPITADNPFLAARLVAAISGAVLLLATWWLARRLFGPTAAVLALLCLALSPLVASYGLYLGTDMPFAAACMLAVALLLGAAASRPNAGRQATRMLGGAGAVAGAAFLLRHPGLLLLPFGVLVIGLGMGAQRQQPHQTVGVLQPLLVFSLAFTLVISPQLYVNLRDTGNPLFNQQAKNIWLAAYANSDWSQATAVPNSIGLSEVVLRDPARFVNNWSTNVIGFFGAGGENTSEFGRADQLRLLAFPANWLSIAALATWLFGRLNLNNRAAAAHAARASNHQLRLIGAWVVLYIVGVSVGLSLVRFALPLVPVYAIAAAWAVLWLAPQLARLLARWPAVANRTLPMLALLLVLVLANGFGIGTGFVLRQQNADERAAVRLVQATLGPGQQVRMELPPRVLFDTYSAIAHQVAPPGQAAAFVLRPATAPAEPGEQAVATAGVYRLFRTKP